MMLVISIMNMIQLWWIIPSHRSQLKWFKQFMMTSSNGLTWWRYQMETFSALLAICAGKYPVPGELLAQRPATRSFDVFFDLRLNKRLSKQWWGWWFETISRPLWRHCNALPCSTLNHVRKGGPRCTYQMMALCSLDGCLPPPPPLHILIPCVCFAPYYPQYQHKGVGYERLSLDPDIHTLSRFLFSQ